MWENGTIVPSLDNNHPKTNRLGLDSVEKGDELNRTWGKKTSFSGGVISNRFSMVMI